MVQSEIRLSDLLSMLDHKEVFKEICHVARLISKGIDFARLDIAIEDVTKLFAGEYPGYRACNTEYHNLIHTTDATLALIRLVHGSVLNGMKFSDHDILLVLVSTLFHDSGYIQDDDDVEGTGAKYTENHVERSVDFIKAYYRKNGFTTEDYEKSAAMIRCTGLGVDIPQINFISNNIMALGKMLGIADLLGQMADRSYLEKLMFLYHEFEEGNVSGFDDEFDLLKKSVGFHKMTEERFRDVLGGYDKNMIFHFKKRYGIDEDLYANAIANHLKYVKIIIKKYPNEYRDKLRRGGLIESLRKRYGK